MSQLDSRSIVDLTEIVEKPESKCGRKRKNIFAISDITLPGYLPS
jgi:hypothetical protein